MYCVGDYVCLVLDGVGDGDDFVGVDLVWWIFCFDGGDGVVVGDFGVFLDCGKCFDCLVCDFGLYVVFIVGCSG